MDIANVITLTIALLTALGTVIYNRRKARTDHAQVALTGYGQLAEKYLAEIARLEKRIEIIEHEWATKQAEWIIERAALVARIKELEDELERVKKGVSMQSP